MSSIDAEVIVIGAGISGLKAAADLHDKGVSTLILEARSRIGGRIYTDRTTEHHYDIGASWFHATMENPLFDKFVQEWYSVENAKYDDANVGFVLDTPSGGFPAGLNVGPIVDEMKYFASHLKEDKSLHNCVIEFFKARGHLMSAEERKYATAIFKFAELTGSADWDMLGAKYAYGPFNGRDAFNTIGYDKIVEKLVENYPFQNILLNTVVQTVEKISDEADNTIIRVETKNGGIFYSRYVVVTLPLGVLKLSVDDPFAEGAVSFIPPLPESITDGFKKTSSATFGKVIVEFEYAFWPDNDKWLVLETPKDNDLDLTKTYNTKQMNYYETDVKAFEFPCLVSNFNVVRNIPSLMFLIPEQAALQVERSEYPTAYGYELIKPIIAKMSGKSIEDIPQPKRVLTTEWGLDPYSRGCISTSAVGDLLVNDALIDGFGTIRFAGESPVAQGHACAHGAYVSGAREAAVILTSLGKN